MTRQFKSASGQASGAWLKKYYFLRAGVSCGWIVLAFLIGRTSPLIGCCLLVLYPAWDAAANFLDAERNGGLRLNISQALNLAISVFAAAAVIYALGIGMELVLQIFGVWALTAGILQLATGVRRWRRYGAQWVMILSGGQSALVSVHFFQKALAVPVPGIEAVIPYAALGAFYFLLSAVWLTVQDMRRREARVVA